MFASTVIGPVAYPPSLLQPSLSAEAAKEKEKANVDEAAEPPGGQASASEPATRGRVAEGESASQPNGETLTEEDLRHLEQLKTTDREVRQHELAHQIAGGQYTGAASYEYERGPDGQRYAVAGTVPIDYGPVTGDPGATIAKMQQVISAALAPADPSPKDHQVAATARQYLLTAQLELAQQQSEMQRARLDVENDGPAAVAAGDSPGAVASERVSLDT